MQNQAYTFAIFLLNGILIGMIFDIFRILRKSFKTPDFITNLEDISFWIVSGFILLYSIFKFNNGELRAYIFVGVTLGIIIYLLIFSKTFIKVNIQIINLLKKVINIIIIIPVKFVYKSIKKIVFRPISFIFINVRKFLSNFIKNITKMYNKNKKIKLKKDFQ